MKLHHAISPQRLRESGTWPVEEATPEKLGLIYNPRSTANRDRLPPRVRDVPCALPSTEAELVDALREFKRKEIGLIAVSGGDGTVREALTALPQVYGEALPRVAIVPSGRTDLIASDLGQRRRSDTLERLAVGAREGTLRQQLRPALHVDGVVDRHGKSRSVRGILLGGAGFVYATRVAQQDVFATGASHARAVTMTAFEVLRRLATQPNPGGLKLGYPIRVGINDKPDEVSAEAAQRVLLVATGLRGPFLFGRTPFHGLPADPDLLHLLDVRGPTRGVTRALASMWINRPWLAGPKWKTATARRIRLEGVPEVVIDGEIFSTQPGDTLEVQAAGPIRFVTP